MFATISRWIAYPLGWLLLMAVPLMIDAVRAGTVTATSAENRFTVVAFVGEYDARRSGDRLAIDVTEHITADFPRRYVNHGIERRLRSSYRGESVELANIRVTGTNGKPIAFTRRSESGSDDVVLRIGSANTYVFGRVDYVISYTIGNAMVQAGDRQEIYLDVNGTGWLQRFDRVQATLSVAPDLAGHLLGEEACYQGAAGSTETCAITRSGDSFSTEALALGPRQNMTIAVGFRPGTVARALPAAVARPGLLGTIGMPVAAAALLALALGVRWFRLRGLLLRGDVPIQYAAPAVQPILAADFLGRPERGAAAQLAQLVLDGHAQLSSNAEPIGTAPQPRARLGRRQRRAVRDEVTVRLIDREQIDPMVRDICAALFGRGGSVQLGEVPQAEVALASRLRQNLLADSDLRRPGRLGALLLGFGYAGLILFGWFVIATGLDSPAWLFLGCGTLAVVLLVAAAHYYPTLGRLTARGRALRDRLAGLHRFVTMAEADRIAWMQNAVDSPRVSASAVGGTGRDGSSGGRDHVDGAVGKGRRGRGEGESQGVDADADAGRATGGTLIDLYEPLLPYAILFGVEDTWRQALGELYRTAPPAVRPQIDVPALTLSVAAARTSPARYRHVSPYRSFWDSRPAWGEGWASRAGGEIGRAFDSWATSRGDDDGGGWGSGGSSGSNRSSGSWSSSSRSSGSSGGGRSGGGIGGGGGGGW
ncbi:MAG TPA: DUF2207 domain-containing protein [Micropruina sp.]|nr:DUF2207 domain-containing protein [Micropruina sp.]